MEHDESLRFEVLGPLRATLGQSDLDLGFPQQRALLALLLVRAGRPVPAGEIVAALWPEGAPASAMNIVRRYVGSLRRLLEPGLPPRAPGRRLSRGADGYRLETAEDEVDLLRFRGLTRRAKREAATGRPEPALRHFVEALDQWRGPVAAGIPSPARDHAVFAEIERELVRTTVMAADAALLCGTPEHVLPHLGRAARLDPLNESLHARNVLALAACGRQAEALAAYESVRRLLVRELGVAPGAELTAAHTRVLRQEVRSAPRKRDLARPAQLPPEPKQFTGRQAELDSLRTAADSSAVLLTGMPGIGKTTLAVRWAHEAAERYPDGQLHMNLRGFDPLNAPLTAEAALRFLLPVLGVPGHRLPSAPDALAGLYRTVLSGRQMLLLLDDAFDTEQVRALLPASPGCLTLITSRRGLSGLVAAGARPLPLDLPSTADALAVLARHIGRERPAADPAAAQEIVAHCGRLPLALAVVAARAASHPGLPLAAVAAELRRSQGSLDALGDVRTAFAASYRHLPDDAARLLRLLSVGCGPDLTADAAAALADLSVRAARRLLDELADAHLVDESAPGRYTAHALLRVFAAELDRRP
ncbi:AfsR/SARP family transcriptional regulator [Streptomyces canus]|uniref:AfsR/SARP family transcriptional regulator n=1 Tax=Streptomyces canus TaxID=58343 RepID=UPI002E328921|nr:BTAD domain-containing putative transcriptional regulator [Streptomyces canus]